MALNIPYPNMDFVPLDILTALELDQMVANIEYIAGSDVFPITTANIDDSAVSGVKIANSAVSSGKMDWTSFGAFSRSANSTNTQNIPANTTTIVLLPTQNATPKYATYSNGRFTITKAGWWAICGQFGGASDTLTASIYVNGEEVRANRAITSGTTVYSQIQHIGYLNANDVVDLRVFCATSYTINSNVKGGLTGVMIQG